MKAKNCLESFEKVRDELRLERRAKAKSNHALVVLKEELERTLSSERNAWAKEQEALQKEVENLRV